MWNIRKRVMITQELRSGQYQGLVIPLLLSGIAVIFVVDTLTDYEITAGCFYTAIVFIAALLLRSSRVIAFASACIALTLLSFAVTDSGEFGIGLVNTGINIVTIAIATWLALKLIAMEETAHESRERVLRMARVTSLGALTASIAHEINQPLTAVITSAGACKRWIAQDPPHIRNAQCAIDRIVTEADRANAVIVKVRGLFSGKPPRKEPFDFNALVLEITDLARNRIDRENITLKLFLQNGLPPVVADRVQIGQVVGNLLLNAVEAMVASTGPVRELKLTSQMEAADKIRFYMIDTGTGFAPGEIGQLFEAFWTTKEDGVGLGLPISCSIIEAHGGRLWAEDNEGGGAVFVFSLPVGPRENK